MANDMVTSSVKVLDDLEIAFHRAARVQDHGMPRYQRIAPTVNRSAEACILGLPPDQIQQEQSDPKEYVLVLDSMDAMAIRLLSKRGFKIKILVGGVNVAVPKESDSSGSGHQDYFVTPAQEWIDGFNVGKGLARQFVVLQPGTGFSVERQITGTDKIRIIEIQIYAPDTRVEGTAVPDGDEAKPEGTPITVFEGMVGNHVGASVQPVQYGETTVTVNPDEELAGMEVTKRTGTLRGASRRKFPEPRSPSDTEDVPVRVSPQPVQGITHAHRRKRGSRSSSKRKNPPEPKKEEKKGEEPPLLPEDLKRPPSVLSAAEIQCGVRQTSAEADVEGVRSFTPRSEAKNTPQGDRLIDGLDFASQHGAMEPVEAGSVSTSITKGQKEALAAIPEVTRKPNRTARPRAEQKEQKHDYSPPPLTNMRPDMPLCNSNSAPTVDWLLENYDPMKGPSLFHSNLDYHYLDMHFGTFQEYRMGDHKYPDVAYSREREEGAATESETMSKYQEIVPKESDTPGEEQAKAADAAVGPSSKILIPTSTSSTTDAEYAKAEYQQRLKRLEAENVARLLKARDEQSAAWEEDSDAAAAGSDSGAREEPDESGVSVFFDFDRYRVGDRPDSEGVSEGSSEGDSEVLLGPAHVIQLMEGAPSSRSFKGPSAADTWLQTRIEEQSAEEPTWMARLQERMTVRADKSEDHALQGHDPEYVLPEGHAAPRLSPYAQLTAPSSLGVDDNEGAQSMQEAPSTPASPPTPDVAPAGRDKDDRSRAIDISIPKHPGKDAAWNSPPQQDAFTRLTYPLSAESELKSLCFDPDLMRGGYSTGLVYGDDERYMDSRTLEHPRSGSAHSSSPTPSLAVPPDIELEASQETRGESDVHQRSSMPPPIMPSGRSVQLPPMNYVPYEPARHPSRDRDRDRVEENQVSMSQQGPAPRPGSLGSMSEPEAESESDNDVGFTIEYDDYLYRTYRRGADSPAGSATPESHVGDAPSAIPVDGDGEKKEASTAGVVNLSTSQEETRTTTAPHVKDGKPLDPAIREMYIAVMGPTSRPEKNLTLQRLDRPMPVDSISTTPGLPETMQQPELLNKWIARQPRAHLGPLPRAQVGDKGKATTDENRASPRIPRPNLLLDRSTAGPSRSPVVQRPDIHETWLRRTMDSTILSKEGSVLISPLQGTIVNDSESELDTVVEEVNVARPAIVIKELSPVQDQPIPAPLPTLRWNPSTNSKDLLALGPRFISSPRFASSVAADPTSIGVDSGFDPSATSAAVSPSIISAHDLQLRPSEFYPRTCYNGPEAEEAQLQIDPRRSGKGANTTIAPLPSEDHRGLARYKEGETEMHKILREHLEKPGEPVDLTCGSAVPEALQCGSWPTRKPTRRTPIFGGLQFGNSVGGDPRKDYAALDEHELPLDNATLLGRRWGTTTSHVAVEPAANTEVKKDEGKIIQPSFIKKHYSFFRRRKQSMLDDEKEPEQKKAELGPRNPTEQTTGSKKDPSTPTEGLNRAAGTPSRESLSEVQSQVKHRPGSATTHVSATGLRSKNQGLFKKTDLIWSKFNVERDAGHIRERIRMENNNDVKTSVRYLKYRPYFPVSLDEDDSEPEKKKETTLPQPVPTPGLVKSQSTLVEEVYQGERVSDAFQREPQTYSAIPTGPRQPTSAWDVPRSWTTRNPNYSTGVRDGHAETTALPAPLPHRERLESTLGTAAGRSLSFPSSPWPPKASSAAGFSHHPTRRSNYHYRSHGSIGFSVRSQSSISFSPPSHPHGTDSSVPRGPDQVSSPSRTPPSSRSDTLVATSRTSSTIAGSSTLVDSGTTETKEAAKMPKQKPAMEIGAGGLIRQKIFLSCEHHHSSSASKSVKKTVTPKWQDIPILVFRVRVVDEAQFQLEMSAPLGLGMGFMSFLAVPPVVVPQKGEEFNKRGSLRYDSDEVDDTIDSVAMAHERAKHEEPAAAGDSEEEEVEAGGGVRGGDGGARQGTKNKPGRAASDQLSAMVDLSASKSLGVAQVVGNLKARKGAPVNKVAYLQRDVKPGGGGGAASGGGSASGGLAGSGAGSNGVVAELKKVPTKRSPLALTPGKKKSFSIIKRSESSSANSSSGLGSALSLSKREAPAPPAPGTGTITDTGRVNTEPGALLHSNAPFLNLHAVPAPIPTPMASAAPPIPMASEEEVPKVQAATGKKSKSKDEAPVEEEVRAAVDDSEGVIVGANGGSVDEISSEVMIRERKKPAARKEESERKGKRLKLRSLLRIRLGAEEGR